MTRTEALNLMFLSCYRCSNIGKIGNERPRKAASSVFYVMAETARRSVPDDLSCLVEDLVNRPERHCRAKIGKISIISET